MKKVFLFVLMLTLICSPAVAIDYDDKNNLGDLDYLPRDYVPDETIDCIVESCDGWEVKRDTFKNVYGKGNHGFYIYNYTGEPAFKIKVVIDSYDIFGDRIDRIEKKIEGPIFEKIVFGEKVPLKAYRLESSVFYTKSLEDNSKDSDLLEAK